MVGLAELPSGTVAFLFTDIEGSTIAEGDATAPYAAFGFPGLAELAAERPDDIRAARDQASTLSYDEVTALS